MHEFIDVNASGTFLGKEYNGAEITPAEFDNHVEVEYIQTLSIGGTRESASERLHLHMGGRYTRTTERVLPLGVEKTKPRLFWDGRWLNKMCRHIPFSMDSVGKVAQTAWKGAHQTTLDHSSGFHHVS